MNPYPSIYSMCHQADLIHTGRGKSRSLVHDSHWFGSKEYLLSRLNVAK